MKAVLLFLLLSALLLPAAGLAETDLFVWRQEDLDAALAAEAGFTRILLQYSRDPMPELPSGLTLCYLDGGPDWSAGDMLSLIRSAARDGVDFAVLDCEGWYTKHTPGQKRFSAFVDQITAAYREAEALGVRLGVCVPFWCEKISRPDLRRLVREGCDELIVMDYSRAGLVDNLSTEARYCREYGKTLQVALMIHPDEAENGETAYWTGGMETLRRAFQEVRDAYGSDIGFSVHHAGYLADFLRQGF